MKRAAWCMAGVLGLAVLVRAEDGVPAAPPPPPPGVGAMGGPGERGFRIPGDFEGMFLRWLSQDQKMAERIGVSQEQVAQIREKVSAAQAEMKDSNVKMQQAAKQQIDLLSQDAPDEAAVMKLVDDIGALNIQIAKRRMKLILDVQKSLTAEQRAKLKEMTRSQMEERRERRRPASDKGATPAAPGAPPPPPAAGR